MEKIELEQPDGKKGLMISKTRYDLLCVFILRMLESGGEVTLTELLDAANKKLSDELTGDALWMILNVKRDLEAKGMVKVKYESRCMQLISVRKNQIRKVKTYLSDARNKEMSS